MLDLSASTQWETDATLGTQISEEPRPAKQQHSVLFIMESLKNTQSN